MMVRNEGTIIADSVGHLLHGVGVDALYVADNGSTDATGEILRRIAAVEPRLRLRPAPGAFLQAEVMRDLVQEAVDDGADWLLPNDADEFLWLDAATIRARCAAAGSVGGFYMLVRNFVQFRRVTRDRPGSIETMTFCARPHGAMVEARALVTRLGLPFVRINYPPKLLLRASASLALRRGQHYADGLAGELAAEPVGELLHAPIRSRDDLHSRVDHGRRLLEVSPSPETGWHLKRLVGLDRHGLDAEWRANSVGLGWRGASGMRLDLRLRRLGLWLRRFRKDALANGEEAVGSFVATDQPSLV